MSWGCVVSCSCNCVVVLARKEPLFFEYGKVYDNVTDPSLSAAAAAAAATLRNITCQTFHVHFVNQKSLE